MKSLKTMLGVGAGVLLIALLVVFRAEVVGALARFRAGLGAAADSSFTYEAFKDLERENTELKAQGESQALAGAAHHDYEYRTAQVYSRYPVGSGGRFILNVGSDDGIKEGMPVLLSDRTLIGKITAARRTQSEAETIWSSTWKSAATVAAGGVKVLLQGGSEPRLELVPKDAAFQEGARVSNVSPDFPIGLFLGVVGAPQAGAQSGLWDFYQLVPPAREDDVNTVLVMLNFP